MITQVNIISLFFSEPDLQWTPWYKMEISPGTLSINQPFEQFIIQMDELLLRFKPGMDARDFEFIDKVLYRVL